MTVIIAYATPDVAFLAADSFRWDLLQCRNLGPVRKVHAASPRRAFATGGAFIDRTLLAERMLAAQANGEGLADAARRLSPALFEFARKRMERSGVSGEQLCVNWYAETTSAGCAVHKHVLPSDRIERLTGLDLMGPDTPWLLGMAEKILQRASGKKAFALDQFAFDLIGQAAARHPLAVGYPAMAIILRPDGRSVLRDDLIPSDWTGPKPEFAVRPSRG